MKKIWIVWLIVFSLFAILINSVVADDEITFTDDEGDVIDYYSLGEEAYANYSEYIDIDNIDITSLTYSRNGKTITLKLKVVGTIENRGNMDTSSESGETSDVALYILMLSTTDNIVYYIYYINNECQLVTENLLEDEGDIENITSFSVENDLLTVSFDLISTEETYEEISASSTYLYENISGSSEEMEFLTDDVYSEPDTENGDTGDNGNTDDQDGEDNNEAGGTDNTTFLFFIAIIAAICVMGVAVIVFIIRR